MVEGLFKIFIEAGAVVSTPTCGPCLGGYMGILAENERWNLKAGGQYFITRNDSSIIAFSIPENGFHGMRIMASHSDSPSFKINFYHIMSCAIRGFWFSLLWPPYPFKYSSRFPYIIMPSETSYIVMLFLPYFDSFCKYKFIFHRRFLYYNRFCPFFFLNFLNFLLI